MMWRRWLGWLLLTVAAVATLAHALYLLPLALTGWLVELFRRGSEEQTPSR